jgi:radical SAM protein with 4Fe4S-binding SPASM domain
MHEADVVANTVNKWLGNPFSRLMLRVVSGRGRHGNRLELALRNYIGEDVRQDFRGRIANRTVRFAIKKGSKSFGVSDKEMKKSLKSPVVRRGIANILEGIARYGVQRPQTCAAPFLIVWDFTHRCNLRCSHCYQDSDSREMPNELTTEEAKRVIDQFEEAGVVAIAFSGGEPLMRRDFFELAGYASKKGFYVTLASNGTLITRDVARKIKKAGVEYAEISLDGFEKTHDRFRGIPGMWRKACRGIRNCVEEGLDTCVAVTVTKWNLKEIPELIDFVEKDLKARKIMFFNFIPTRRGKEIAKQDITPQEREELLKFLYSKLIDKKCRLSVFSTAPQYSRVAKEYAEGPTVATHFTNRQAIKLLSGRTRTLAEFIGGCGCGRLYAALEPNGDVFPCVFLPLKIGNIREEGLRDMWDNSKVLKRLRDRDGLKGCGKCEHRFICGGCRARAYGYFGDLQGPDPGCIRNLEYWKELKSGG